MTDDEPGSLSRSFQENAKDDRRAALFRTADQFPGGREILESIEQKGLDELERRQQLEIEQTQEQRFAGIVLDETRRRGAVPEPGRETHPLTPAEYEYVKKEATRLLVEDTARRQALLEQEVQDQTLGVAERTFQRMERQQERGRDLGRGMERDDL